MKRFITCGLGISQNIWSPGSTLCGLSVVSHMVVVMDTRALARVVILSLVLVVGLVTSADPYNEDNYDHRCMYLLCNNCWFEG